ncbi:MAG: SDR family NAD(P)-dependent oxidoreductase, partial [Candidatus Neomarinimicrobiota bacterium]
MNIFITGASRGLGLEFVKQFKAQGNNVTASCRDPENAHELQKTTALENIINLDVSSPISLKSAAKELQTRTEIIDILINNAGIIGPKNEFYAESKSL